VGGFQKEGARVAGTAPLASAPAGRRDDRPSAGTDGRGLEARQKRVESRAPHGFVQLNALMTFTNAAAICRMFSSV
jgi:hypothetical protein